MTERKELIERLRDYAYEGDPLYLMEQAADMLEADISRQVEVSESTRRIRKSALGTSTCRTQLRAELIARLRDATEGPRMLMGEAADMLEADAPAVPQEPVAWYEYNADLDAWFLAYGHNPKAKTRPLVFGDAAPQPQQPRLTDEEIEDFADASTGYSRMVDIKYFARAIERKVRGEA